MKVTSQDVLNLAKAFEVDAIRGYSNIKHDLLYAIQETVRTYREQLREKKGE